MLHATSRRYSYIVVPLIVSMTRQAFHAKFFTSYSLKKRRLKTADTYALEILKKGSFAPLSGDVIFVPLAVTR